MTVPAPCDPAYAPSELSLSAETVTHARMGQPGDVADAVRRWGIAVFPGLVAGEMLAGLNAEFDRMIAGRRDLGVPVDEYANMVNLRLTRDRLSPVQFPATAAFFAQPFMAAIADAYFGPGAYRLNGEIFVTDLAETAGPQTVPPFALHFDKRQVLKFFVYLTDTDETNGAMRVLPGSNLRNRHVRENAMADRAINDIVNILPEPETPSVPVRGPAGTLFVFDTDVCHGASVVQPGHRRRTMRGHTHSHAMLKAMGVR
ncbi:MAG: phytanoyl-CoA dioxygenase family protein [Rhodospirillaceae bacterium]|nr:phytanoyl-CoA dioxygenase family protein [Rhodospirillaceae bacterium]